MGDVLIRVLGPFEVERDGQVEAVTARRNRLVLAMLAAQPNRIVPMERLIAALWDEDPPRTARTQIHICVSALRTALADAGCIQTHPAGYTLRIPDDNVDCRRFERLLDEVKSLDTGDEPERALRLLDTALGLWRGSAYDGLSGPLIETMAVWLDQRRVVAVEERVEIRLKLGRDDPDEIAELCARHPLRERLHGFLMVSLYRAGRQADALAAYQHVRTLLLEELGIEPGRELRAIEQAILNQDQAIDLSMRGSGRHRIVLAPHQLPRAVPDFTGRADCLEQLCAELRPADPAAAAADRRTPVVLITGMCGVGKTTLAVEAGHRLLDCFPDGQLFARLDGSTTRPAEPAGVLERLLRGLGVDVREIPHDAEARSAMLRSLLGGKRVLILLDDAVSESQIRPLLPGLPGCAVLITSRRRLVGIPGVNQFELGMLPDGEATELLAAVVPDRRLAADPASREEIVRFCGGLPFALRIAGSRLAAHPHWEAAELVRRMSDEKRRLDQLVHDGVEVRVLLAVAYETLSDRARRLLRLLSALSIPDFGAWHAAVAAGCSMSEILPLLDELAESRLIDAGLRQMGTVRYRFHDLVRLFAVERSAVEDGPAEQARVVADVLAVCLSLLREEHRRAYGGDYATVGEPPRPVAFSQDDLEKLLRDPAAWFADERSALVALVAQAANNGWPAAAWNIAVASVVFFEAQGCFDDWRTTHELALAAAQRYGSPRGEAAVLCSLGSLGISQGGKFTDGGLLRALTLFEQLGDTVGRALALRNLAHLDRVRGSRDSAFRRYRDALDAFRSAGDPVGEAHALSGLAQTHLEADDVVSAERYSRESLRLAQSIGNRRLESQALYRLANVLAARGDHAAARANLAAALDIIRASEDRVGRAHVLTAMAAVLVDLDDLSGAERLVAEVTELCDELADRRLLGRAIMVRARVHEARGNYASAETLLLSATAIFGDRGGAAWQARALESISRLRRRFAA